MPHLSNIYSQRIFFLNHDKFDDLFLNHKTSLIHIDYSVSKGETPLDDSCRSYFLLKLNFLRTQILGYLYLQYHQLSTPNSNHLYLYNMTLKQ